MINQETHTASRLILSWSDTIPDGYGVTASDESTHTMVVVRQVKNNGQDIKEPCPV